MARNVLGTELQVCSIQPLTGFTRNGCCDTGPEDTGSHTVCAEVTEEFLVYSQAQGNDLSTPRPEYNFDGLKPGDRWCLAQNCSGIVQSGVGSQAPTKADRIILCECVGASA